MRIGTSQWTGYEPLFLARDRAYFDSDTARLIEYTSNTETARAFRNGAVDAVSITLDEVVKLRRAGVDARIVLVIDVSHGADVILARPDIGSLSGLRGRRVGFEITSLGDYMLSRALEGVNMTMGDVEVVPLEISEHERAFKEGVVDAVVTYEPVRAKLLAFGARKLFDSSQIPGEIMDVLVVHASFLGEDHDQLVKVIDAWFRALDEIKKNRRGAVHAIAQRERITIAEVETSLVGLRFPDLEENRAMLAGPAPRLIGQAERLVEVMVKRKLVSERVDLRSSLDGTHLPGMAR